MSKLKKLKVEESEEYKICVQIDFSRIPLFHNLQLNVSNKSTIGSLGALIDKKFPYIRYNKFVFYYKQQKLDEKQIISELLKKRIKKFSLFANREPFIEIEPGFVSKISCLNFNNHIFYPHFFDSVFWIDNRYIFFPLSHKILDTKIGAWSDISIIGTILSPSTVFDSQKLAQIAISPNRKFIVWNGDKYVETSQISPNTTSLKTLKIPSNLPDFSNWLQHFFSPPNSQYLTGLNLQDSLRMCRDKIQLFRNSSTYVATVFESNMLILDQQIYYLSTIYDCNKMKVISPKLPIVEGFTILDIYISKNNQGIIKSKKLSSIWGVHSQSSYYTLFNFDVEELIHTQKWKISKWSCEKAIRWTKFSSELIVIFADNSHYDAYRIYDYDQNLLQKISSYLQMPLGTTLVEPTSVSFSPNFDKIAIFEGNSLRVYHTFKSQIKTLLLLGREKDSNSFFYRDTFPLDLLKLIFHYIDFCS